MPFDQELYEGYCIRYPEKKSRKEKESLFGLLVVLWGCCLFFGMLNAIGHSSSRMRSCTCAFLQSGSSSVTQSTAWIKGSMLFTREERNGRFSRN